MFPLSRTIGFALLLAITLIGAGCDSGGLAPSRSIEVAARGAQAGTFSNDSGYAIVGSVQHGGSLWRTQDGERLFNWNHKPSEQTVLIASAFSDDGQWALTADAHTLVLWRISDGQALRYWNAPGEILDVALGTNGRFALLGLADGTAVLFDVQRGGIQRTFHHDGRVRSVALSRNGRIALTGSEDQTATLWNVETGRAMQQIQHQDDVQMVALSGDGLIALSAAKYDRAVVWDTRTGKTLGDVPLAAEKLARGLRFTAARFSEDGVYLLTGRPDQVIQLWDTRSLKQVAQWRAPKRNAWKPTSAAIVCVGFGQRPKEYWALASNGFIHRLSR